MPSGVYIRTKNHCKNISRSLKGKVPWDKGLKRPPFTEEHCKNMSEAHKGKPSGSKGLKRSKQWKKEQSERMKGKLKGRIPWNKGKKTGPQTEEHKEKIRQSKLKQVIFPFKNTSIELKLQEALKELNIKFETHVPIYGVPDIFIKPNICIFADGDYWHANPAKYKKDQIVHSNKIAKDIWNKDRKIIETLERKGYKVLRFWEHEINNNLESCMSKVRKEV